VKIIYQTSHGILNQGYTQKNCPIYLFPKRFLSSLPFYGWNVILRIALAKADFLNELGYKNFPAPVFTNGIRESHQDLSNGVDVSVTGHTSPSDLQQHAMFLLDGNAS
jgi:hypothetical protein